MSRKGNCWDNTVAEFFFSSLKKARVRKQIYKDRSRAEAEVAEYIEDFYHPVRHHSHLAGLSPDQFKGAHRHPRKALH